MALPCRHATLCQECADVLQSADGVARAVQNRCLVCRAVVEAMVPVDGPVISTLIPPSALPGTVQRMEAAPGQRAVLPPLRGRAFNPLGSANFPITE